MRRRPQPRGYVLLDITFAIGLIALVFLALATATAQQRRSAVRLAERRVAVDLAERALQAMQEGRPPEVQVEVRPLGEATPAGLWVEVRAKHGEAQASLIGLVAAHAAADSP
jgi:type II secretory pathway pseudopilin PulG